MLIHPWDEAGRDVWQGLLARTDFGQLVTAGHVDGYPVVVPTHFLYDGDATVLLHLARPNPVWRALDADPHVVLALIADYVYVEAGWNANPDTDPDLGVPTSYYTGLQLLCRAEVVDDQARRRRSSPSSCVTSSPRARPGWRATGASCPASGVSACASRRCVPRRSTAATSHRSTGRRSRSISQPGTVRWTVRPAHACSENDRATGAQGSGLLSKCSSALLDHALVRAGSTGR